MKHVDLFSGFGGFALAASWIWGKDYENVGHSELEPFACKLYHKHFPRSECLGDITEINWSKFKGIDLITGGFPCQPFSVAGKRRGSADHRHLWPEMYRAVREIRPRWVIGENVTGIIRMELDQVLSDLESADYATEAFIIPACAVNAPHRRDRIWVVAKDTRHGDGSGKSHKEKPICEVGEGNSPEHKRSLARGRIGPNDLTENNSSLNVRTLTHADRAGRREQRRSKSIQAQQRASQRDCWAESWFEVATRLCRVDDGVRNRVDRLRGLGNAIVPQIVFEIMKAIQANE